MLNRQTGGGGQEAAATAQGLAGHWSGSGEQLHSAALLLYILLSLLLLLF